MTHDPENRKYSFELTHNYGLKMEITLYSESFIVKKSAVQLCTVRETEKIKQERISMKFN